jgi:glucose/mannose-6-phosphate isomerase
VNWLERRELAVIGGDMLDAVKAIPDHLRDALWRIESARASTMEAPAAFVCGMGGSAIGGDLAVAALADRLTKPMQIARGYELPSWAPAGSAVLCSSYSGDTEETLACYAAAEALGAQRLVATTGGELAESARSDGVPVIGLPAGLQPRAAVGYMFCVSAELAALALAGPRIHTEIDAAASRLGQGFAAAEARARELAEEIGDATLVIYGSDLTAPVAYRWKTQVNENAKLPAFASVLPEADHNEIEGWSGAEGRFAAIFLEDRDQHPRERKRFELTAKAIEPYAAAVITLETEGETRTERILHAVMLGDLLSIELANARGVDPVAVDVLEGFKREMGRP